MVVPSHTVSPIPYPLESQTMFSSKNCGRASSQSHPSPQVDGGYSTDTLWRRRHGRKGRAGQVTRRWACPLKAPHVLHVLEQAAVLFAARKIAFSGGSRAAIGGAISAPPRGGFRVLVFSAFSSCPVCLEICWSRWVPVGGSFFVQGTSRLRGDLTGCRQLAEVTCT